MGWAGLRSGRSHLSFSPQGGTQERGLAASRPRGSPHLACSPGRGRQRCLGPRGEQRSRACFCTGCVHISPRGTPGPPRWSSGREPASPCRRHKRHRFDPRVRKIPWRRAWHPTPVFLPGESHGQRSLAGCGPCGHTELDTTEAAKHSTAQ